MEGSNSDLSERQTFRLREILKEMSISYLHKLAEEWEIEIPFEARDTFTIIDAFLDELSPEAKHKILEEYEDAGRASTYIFVSKKKAPEIQTAFSKAEALLRIENTSQFIENYPYYDEVEVHHSSGTLRIRFHYLKGTIFTLDRSGSQREHRLYHSGVVVYRPGSRILEIRVRHVSIAKKMAVGFPVRLGMEPSISLNLRDEKLIRAFVNWISSLNSATIELPISDVAGSIRITAKRGMDLRTAERFNEELKYGRFRGGHVTIERQKGHIVNFRIFFRDCHITYTLFTSEDDIEYVVSALEKIVEGYEFDVPYKMLTQFFEKED